MVCTVALPSQAMNRTRWSASSVSGEVVAAGDVRSAGNGTTRQGDTGGAKPRARQPAGVALAGGPARCAGGRLGGGVGESLETGRGGSAADELVVDGTLAAPEVHVAGGGLVPDDEGSGGGKAKTTAAAVLWESGTNWRRHAASTCRSGTWVNPGCHRWKSSASESLRTRVRSCRSRWAPPGFHRICCFLTIRLLITWLTADSAIELEMTSPAR